ncbi:hypothetical protein GCM10023142_23070 [Anaerocolumna aminovalerica]
MEANKSAKRNDNRTAAKNLTIVKVLKAKSGLYFKINVLTTTNLVKKLLQIIKQ